MVRAALLVAVLLTAAVASDRCEPPDDALCKLFAEAKKKLGEREQAQRNSVAGTYECIDREARMAPTLVLSSDGKWQRGSDPLREAGTFAVVEGTVILDGQVFEVRGVLPDVELRERVVTGTGLRCWRAAPRLRDIMCGTEPSSSPVEPLFPSRNLPVVFGPVTPAAANRQELSPSNR